MLPKANDQDVFDYPPTHLLILQAKYTNTPLLKLAQRRASHLRYDVRGGGSEYRITSAYSKPANSGPGETLLFGKTCDTCRNFARTSLLPDHPRGPGVLAAAQNCSRKQFTITVDFFVSRSGPAQMMPCNESGPTGVAQSGARGWGLPGDTPAQACMKQSPHLRHGGGRWD